MAGQSCVFVAALYSVYLPRGDGILRSLTNLSRNVPAIFLTSSQVLLKSAVGFFVFELGDLWERQMCKAHNAA